MENIYRLGLETGEVVYVCPIDKQGYPKDIFEYIEERKNKFGFVTFKNMTTGHTCSEGSSYREGIDVHVKVDSIVSIIDVYEAK